MHTPYNQTAIFGRLLLLCLLVLLLVGVSACARAGPAPTSTAAPAAGSLAAASTASPATAVSAPPTSQAASPSSVPARSSPAPTATPETPPPTATSPSPSPSPSAAHPTPGIEVVRLRLEPVASGLEQPVFVTHAGDGSGRLFIVEKPGVIRVLDQGQLAARPVLHIRDRVLSRGSEQGLLGLAFAPDFGRSGTFFVNYTDLSGDTVVSRFRVTGDGAADPAGESVLLRIDQPAANHNGGMLAFGPDGYLYVGTGDGGGANDRYGNGQNPKTLLGKILRLDVTSDPTKPYTIPPDNPWVNTKWNGQDIRPEIWAMGLRNPWRYSFDRDTGDLWIADVGQAKYEEIDRVPAGGDGRIKGGLNFGWPIMEGTHCFPDGAQCRREGLTLPVTDYSHGVDGCSITGGAVYRGAANPGLAGAYLYGDYCSGRIWALTQGANGAWQSRLLLESGLSISSFGEDEAGEIYVVDLGGAVYRIAAG
jgi:glucose/arabinose dehydrogenase